MRETTLPLDHFEGLYARRSDPWHLATSNYEQAKFTATLAALPRPRYAKGLEIGCAIGVLTEMLAERCETLLAVEPVEAALEQARTRNAGKPHVRFAKMFVPGEWPSGTFDLLVLSEVIDYLGGNDILRLAERVRESLDPGGDMVLVHWVGKKRGRSSGEASDAFIAATADSLTRVESRRNRDYRLDLLRRR